MASHRPGTDVADMPGVRSACLVPGCGCRDARVLSRRRAAFFAALARSTGETADRIVEVEASWRLPAALDGPGIGRDSADPDEAREADLVPFAGLIG